MFFTRVFTRGPVYEGNIFPNDMHVSANMKFIKAEVEKGEMICEPS
jgi:hypothetical protein